MRQPKIGTEVFILSGLDSKGGKPIDNHGPWTVWSAAPNPGEWWVYRQRAGHDVEWKAVKAGFLRYARQVAQR
jgi:hypothetical protein